MEEKSYSREEYEEIRKKYEIITKHSVECIWILNLLTKKFDYVSPSVFNLLGYIPEEVINLPVEATLTQESFEKVEKHIEERCKKFVIGKEEKSIDEFQMVKKNGMIVDVEISSSFIWNEETKSINVVGITRDISDKKKIIERTGMILKTMADGFVLIDKNAAIADVNDSYCRMSGYTREELLKLKVFDIDYNYDSPKNKEYMKKLHDIETYKSVKFESIHKKKDGTHYPVEITINLLHEDNEMYHVAIVRDLTSQEELEKNFKSYVENAPDAIFVADEKGKYIDVNPAATDLTGFSKEELLQRSIKEMIPEDEREAALESFYKLRDIPKNYVETSYLRKDGERRMWGVKAVKLSENRFLGFVRDITERIEREKKIELSEQRLMAAQRMAKIGNWELDIKTNTLHWSDEIYNIFEVDKEEFEATYEGFLNAIHPDDRELVNRAYTESLKNRTEYRITHRLLLQNGKIKYVEENGSSYFDRAGLPIKSIGTVQDITEIKNYEKNLIKAKEDAESANRVKTEFLSNVSHELRTPLNGIIGFASILEERSMDEDMREMFDIIKESSYNLLALINDILDMAKIEEGKMKVAEDEISLMDIIKSTAEIFQIDLSRKGVEYLLAGEEIPEKIIGDSKIIRQIFMNLISNSVKFTEKGFIRNTLRILAKRDGVIWIEIINEDTGIGIGKKKMESLFTKFEQGEHFLTKKYGGTGLGLSIVKGLVDLLGGNIYCESKVNEGTKFILEIPFKAP